MAPKGKRRVAALTVTESIAPPSVGGGGSKMPSDSVSLRRTAALHGALSKKQKRVFG